MFLIKETSEYFHWQGLTFETTIKPTASFKNLARNPF